MAFINTVTLADAEGPVRDLYERQQSHYGYVPNYAKLFSHRPEVMQLWSDLLYGVRRNMDKRRFELVTVAAAMAVRSTYCSLAHGKALTEYYSIEDVVAIVTGADAAPLTTAETEMMRFARKIAHDAADVVAGDVERLKAHGLTDAEVFDIAAVATARSFFAQLCEGLGAVGDQPHRAMDGRLKNALTVGKRFETTPRERLAESYDRDLAAAFQ